MKTQHKVKQSTDNRLFAGENSVPMWHKVNRAGGFSELKSALHEVALRCRELECRVIDVPDRVVEKFANPACMITHPKPPTIISCGHYDLQRDGNGHLHLSNAIGESMVVNEARLEIALASFFRPSF
jgi:hypothetical protein